MALVDQIQKYITQLPPEKQIEVLDFIAFLQQRENATRPKKQSSLKGHIAFGSWKNRNIDAIQYQRKLRSEWDQ